MKFKYKPSEESKSFNQFINYLLTISPVYQIYFFAMKIIILLMICATIIEILSSFYNMFFLVLGLGTVLSIITALVVLGIIKLLEKRKLKKIANKTFNDNDSTFYFTIENNCIIRESDNSKVEIPLNDISSIELLKGGLVLNSVKASIMLFIPNYCLPVSVEEFIEIFKKTNPSLKVDEIKREKKILNKRYYVIALVAVILSILVGYLVGKTNYEGDYVKKNLVMQNELVYYDIDDTYLYENKEYGLGIYFPKEWEGKYGVEALEDRINVYYLPKGKEGPKTTLLFTVSKTLRINDFENFNAIRDEGSATEKFRFYAPKEVGGLSKKEFEEYKQMYTKIKFLNIKLIR